MDALLKLPEPIDNSGDFTEPNTGMCLSHCVISKGLVWIHQMEIVIILSLFSLIALKVSIMTRLSI